MDKGISTKTTRIGGKGTMRRKRKNINRRRIKTQEELRLNAIISTINKKILALNSNNYSKLRLFIDELIDDYLKDLSKDDVNTRTEHSYKNIKLYGKGFFYKYFFYPINNEKILIKSDLYQFLTKYFRPSGKNLIIKLVQSIDKILVEKEYDINLASEKYDEETFNRALEFFDIDSNKKVHFKEIRTKYREFIDSKVTDKEGNDFYDKDKTNMYFSILSKQYNDYLKSR